VRPPSRHSLWSAAQAPSPMHAREAVTQGGLLQGRHPRPRLGDASLAPERPSCSPAARRGPDREPDRGPDRGPDCGPDRKPGRRPGRGPTAAPGARAQAVSSRPDVAPPSYTAELEKLQDQIPPFPSADAMAVLAAELGAPASVHFADLSPEPVAAASLGQVRSGARGRRGKGGGIGCCMTQAVLCRSDTSASHKPGEPGAQVYKGRLRASGRAVAVKVQRPDVRESIALDVHILRAAAGWFARWRRLNSDLPALLDEARARQPRRAPARLACTRGRAVTQCGDWSPHALRLVPAVLCRTAAAFWLAGAVYDAARLPLHALPEAARSTTHVLSAVQAASGSPACLLAPPLLRPKLVMQALNGWAGVPRPRPRARAQWAASLFRELDYTKEATNGVRFRELYSRLEVPPPLHTRR